MSRSGYSDDGDNLGLYRQAGRSVNQRDVGVRHMAIIIVTTDDGVERGKWEDTANHIGSLVDRVNRQTLMRDVLTLVQETRIEERRPPK